MYEVVFEAVTDQFIVDMFGNYANDTSRETFNIALSIEGWKYFEVQNLNELFSIEYRRLIKDGALHIVNELDDSDFMSSSSKSTVSFIGSKDHHDLLK